MPNSDHNFIKSSLHQLGVEDFDVKVYYTIFRKGNMGVSAISRELGVERPTIYAAIERLKKHGLIPQNHQAYSRHIAIEPPTRITSLIDRKRASLAEQRQQLDKLLPDLMMEYAIKNHPSALRIFEGRDQYLTVLEESVKEATDEIVYLGNVDIFVQYEGLGHEKKWIAERIRRKIPIRLIVFPFKDWRTAQIEGTNKTELRETRFMDKENSFDGSFMLYGYKTFLWNPLAERAVIIDDPIISKMFKQIFEIVWANAKKRSK